MTITNAVQTVATQMAKVTQTTATAMLQERISLEKLVCDTGLNYVLYGPPGTGKSSMARNAARAAGLEAYPVQCSDQMSGASFFQIAWVEPSGAMVVKKGPGLTSFESGGLLIVEEINEASQDALGVLTMLMVRGIGANVRTMDNDLITQHPKARVIATMNGDPAELPERILDRARAVPISCPSPAMLKTLPNDLARLTTRAYAATFETQLPEGLPFTFRQMQALAELRTAAPLPLAALVAFDGNREMATLFCESLLPLIAAPDGSRQKATEA